MKAGVVLLPKGIWAHNTESGTTATALAPDTLTDIARGRLLQRRARRGRAGGPAMTESASAAAAPPRRRRRPTAPGGAGACARRSLLTVGVLVLEVAGGIASGSLALLADAAHMFTDVAALTLAWAGMALGDRAPTRRHTFGLARAEVLAAFVNAQLLLVAGAAILWEAWRRFQAPSPVQNGPDALGRGRGPSREPRGPRAPEGGAPRLA